MARATSCAHPCCCCAVSVGRAGKWERESTVDAAGPVLSLSHFSTSLAPARFVRLSATGAAAADADYPLALLLRHMTTMLYIHTHTLTTTNTD